MKPDKNTMKRLREENAERVAAARENQKTRRAEMKKVRDAMAAGPATIPELAQKAGLSARDTLWWVMALKKYGMAAEGAKKSGYFQYQMVEGGPSAGPAGDE